MKVQRPEDLGGLGESFFETLCKNAGYVANRSHDDKCGWDFEVEHPGHEATLYKNQSHPVYRVQVKATATGKNEVSFSYSNLLSLIRYGGASFIFFAKYKSNMMYPYDAYLVHVDEKMASDTLKAMRRTEIKDSQFSISKRKRMVKFRESDRLASLNGTGLRNSFETFIAADYLKYVEQKTVYLKKIEKKAQTKEFHLTLNSEKDLNDMADCLLGYDKRFRADTKSYEAPFGLRDSEPYSAVKNYQSTISPVLEELPKVIIYLKNSKHGREYRFDGIVYTVPPPVSYKVKKLRIATALFDFVVDLNTQKPQLIIMDIFNEDIKVSFRDLYNFLCFLDAAGNGLETFIGWTDLRTNRSVDLSLGVIEGQLPDQFPLILNAVTATYEKLHKLNLDDKIISTCLIGQQFNRFNLFYIIGKKYEPEYVLNFRNDSTNSKDADVVLFKSTLELQDVILVLFVAFFGKVENLRGDVLRGRFYESEFMGEFILNASDENESFLKDESHRYEEELSKRGFHVLN